MASLQQIEAALRAADAAGNHEDAARLAQAYAAARASQSPKPRPQAVDTPYNPAENFHSTLQIATPWKTYDTGIGLPDALTLGLAGAGKSFDDTALGARQVYANVADKVAPQHSLSGLISGQDGRSARVQREVDERRTADAPLMNTGAGFAGNVAGGVAQSLLPGGAVAKGAKLLPLAGRAVPYLAAAAEGALYNGAQPVATGESRAANAAMGAGFGAGGQAAVSVGGAAARGLSQSPAVRQAAAQARRVGVQLLPSQLTNNGTVQAVQSALNKLPLSGVGRAIERQRGDFNEALGAHLGVRTRALDAQAFDQAMSQAGNTFDTLSARNSLDLNHALGPLSQIEQEVSQYGTETQQRAVKSAIDELMRGAQGSNVPGKLYKELDSKWGRLTRGGGETAHYLGQVREAVRGAMDNSISPQDAAAWKAVRARYRDLKTVEPLVGKETGEGISPRALMGRVNGDKAGRASMARGRRGPLGEMAKVGQRIADKTPDSGTALRSLVYNGGLPLLGAAGASSDNPYAKGAGIGLLGLVGGGMLARAGNSAALGRYLTEGNQFLQGVGRTLPAQLTGRNLPRLAAMFPVAANAEAPLELDISGGTVGAPISPEELEALRRQAYGY